MKKILCFFGALTFVLISSCSNDDDKYDDDKNDSESSSTDLVLVKKISSIINNGASTSTYNTTFTYDGNKLKAVTYSDQGSDVYTYTGDLLTKLEYFKVNNSIGENTNIFIYDTNSNSISETVTGNDDHLLKIVYTRNTDGTTSYIRYSGDKTSQTSKVDSGKIFFSNNEVSKVEMYNGDDILYKMTTYTYDDKKNPIGNIKGYDKIGFVLFSGFYGISHNMLTQDEFYPNNPSQNTTRTYKYSYDEKGYPTALTIATAIVGYTESITYLIFSY